jgi:predicted transcriptional regulator
VVTRRDLLNLSLPDTLPVQDLVKRPPAIVFGDSTLREAADHMINEDIGRLPVVSREDPRKVIGFLTRSDLLKAHRQRLDDMHKAQRQIRLRHHLGNLEFKRNGK